MISGQDQTKALYDYCEQWSEPHSQLLGDLYRETYLKTMKPRMASGPLQGRILSLISKMIRPSYVLEIGTFTGYAALCLAEGLAKGGKLVTIEVNPELAFISNKYFQKSEWSNQIKPVVGNALEIIPKLGTGIDLVFIDAKKQDYGTYYDLLIEKVNSGGVILADNILWDGKVLQDKKDKTTQAINDFNIKIAEDPRVSSAILPLRDGVNVIMKNE